MPLPSVRIHGAKQCLVKSKRTGLPCNNPAAFGTKACRIHGAHRARTGLSGTNHPNYQHGNCTNKARSEYRAARIRLLELESLMVERGLIVSKPKGYERQKRKSKD